MGGLNMGSFGVLCEGLASGAWRSHSSPWGGFMGWVQSLITLGRVQGLGAVTHKAPIGMPLATPTNEGVCANIALHSHPCAATLLPPHTHARTQADSGGVAGDQQGPAEHALRAMLLHVDADAAYRAALGLYELPLAFMVITLAQVCVCV